MRPPILLALAALAAGLAAPALADGDPAKGEKVFAKCKSCHAVGEGAESKVGPVLNGIVGRAIGSVKGFAYSDAFLAKQAEGFVWSEEAIAAYLEKPKDCIADNKMSFAGLRKPEERANVIAYLKGFQ